MSNKEINEKAVTPKSFIRHSKQLALNIETMRNGNAIPTKIAITLIAMAAFWSKNGDIFPSQKTIAQKTNQHIRTVRRHIALASKLNIISITSRQPITKNGITKRLTNIYSFNDFKIKELTSIAHQNIKKCQIIEEKRQAKKASIAAKKESKKQVKNIEKCPLKNFEKCPPILLSKDKIDLSINTKQFPKKIPLSKIQYLKNVIQAAQDELAHITKVKKDKAYQAAIKRNQIAEGKRFTDEEQERRNRMIDKERPTLNKNIEIRDLFHSLAKKLTQSVLSNQFSSFAIEQAQKLVSIVNKGVYKLTMLEQSCLDKYMSNIAV